jgi:hypothetical protein
MCMKSTRSLRITSGALLAVALVAHAQTPTPPPPASEVTANTASSTDSAAILKDIEEMKARIAQLEAQLKAQAAAAAAAAAAAPAPAPAPAAPAAPAAPTWSLGPMDVSGYIDVGYTYNVNRPSDKIDGVSGYQLNQLYNFNDKANQFNLSAVKLTLNHDADPVGAHLDLLFGRTNTLVNDSGSPNDSTKNQGNYIEQAYMSFKPAKAKGLELDLGKFVTSAGAEVIESKDNWNYSRSLLFVNAIPYFHLGLRTTYPLTKSETIGVQVVNGWNNVSKTNGGVTIGLTSSFVKPKYTWNLNYYTGPENPNTQKGYRNLFDSTLILTPTAKFSAYLNYDYGQNRDAIAAQGDKLLNHWQGAAVAVRQQLTAKNAVAGRFEYFSDPQGFMSNGSAQGQDLKEFTATYEYKWIEGLLGRFEYRRDWSTINFFTKGNTLGAVKAQSTLTAGFVAYFGPKR